MSQIDIRREHDLGLADAQQVADDIAADLAEKFSVDYGWDGDTIQFERPGVSGSIRVDDSEIHVTAELGLLLSYLKPSVEREINNYLEAHFG